MARRDITTGRTNVRGVLLASLRTAFDQTSWHGPNLTTALRGVHAAAASKRFGRRKTIWEQTLHAAYWKHVALNKLAGTTRFPRRGSNWPGMPEQRTESAWRADVDLLRATQRRLIEVIEAIPNSRFNAKTIWLIQGAAAHDLYHTGQIRLLKRLL
jgi:hypothetical protein